MLARMCRTDTYNDAKVAEDICTNKSISRISGLVAAPKVLQHLLNQERLCEQESNVKKPHGYNREERPDERAKRRLDEAVGRPFI